MRGPTRRDALTLLGATGAVAWTAPSIVSVAGAGTGSVTPPDPCALCGTNLVGNASGESYAPDAVAHAQYDPNLVGVGTAPPATPDGWTTTNGFRVVTYGSTEYPATAPSGAGTVMFSGSLDGGSASPGTASRTALVGACATEIDTGTVAYSMSAHLGGASTYGDTMTFTAAFRDAADGVLSTASLGPVAATSGFGSHSTVGTVPPQTRSVVFTLTATRVEPSHPRTTAAADLLSFTICP
jgi:hypothetical protein